MPYRDRDGKIVMVKDIASKDIIQTTGDTKPVYFAVTVADYMGYENRLSLEGLAFRLLGQPQEDLINVDKTLNNLYRIYSFRGLLRNKDPEIPMPAPDLKDIPKPVAIEQLDLSDPYVYDEEVYKDINTRRLVTNYAAAHLRLCIYYIENHEYEEAVRELQRATTISPTYEGYKDIAIATYGYAGRVAKAESLAMEFLAVEPNNVNLYMQLFNVYRRANRPADAEQVLTRLINTLPDDPEGYSVLTTFYRERKEYDKAEDVVRRWLSLHPRDKSAARLLETLQQEAGQAGS